MTQNAMTLADAPEAARIAAQNDAFRRLACLGEPLAEPLKGRLVLTRSIMLADDSLYLQALEAVGHFASFEPDNDPEGWHDFGAVEVQEEKLFWKIDLYQAGSDFRWGAEQPDNPATTTRVLTIMKASDW